MALQTGLRPSQGTACVPALAGEAWPSRKARLACGFPAGDEAGLVERWAGRHTTGGTKVWAHMPQLPSTCLLHVTYVTYDMAALLAANVCFI
jgi:hypothetical protein